MIIELDLVELLEDSEKLKKGSRGTVVDIGSERKLCLVEFFDMETGETTSVEMVQLKNLKKL